MSMRSNKNQNDGPHSKAALLSRGIVQPTLGTSQTLPIFTHIDKSSSMSGLPIADACAAVTTLASVLSAPENMGAFLLGLAVFDHEARELVPPAAAASFSLPPGIVASGGTDFTKALTLASALAAPFAAGPESARRPTIVFLTDGRHETPFSDPLPLAEALRRSANVIAIGVGPNADAAFLAKLASAPHLVIRDTSSAALAATFGAIGKALSRSRRAGVSIAAAGIDPFASRRR